MNRLFQILCFVSVLTGSLVVASNSMQNVEQEENKLQHERYNCPENGTVLLGQGHDKQTIGLNKEEREKRRKQYLYEHDQRKQNYVTNSLFSRSKNQQDPSKSALSEQD